MKAYVYILQSIRFNSYYIGSTENLDIRIRQHNSGNVKSTRNRKPYILVFYQEFDNIKVANQIEHKIKSWKRKDFVEKIIKDGEINMRTHSSVG